MKVSVYDLKRMRYVLHKHLSGKNDAVTDRLLHLIYVVPCAAERRLCVHFRSFQLVTEHNLHITAPSTASSCIKAAIVPC